MPIVETLQRYLTETPGQVAARAGIVFWAGRRLGETVAEKAHVDHKLAG